MQRKRTFVIQADYVDPKGNAHISGNLEGHLIIRTREGFLISANPLNTKSYLA